MRRYLWIKLLILASCFVVGILLFRQSHMMKHASEYQNKKVVYDIEVKDMFQVADIQSDEAEEILLPEISTILTWKDTSRIYTTLGFYNIVQEASEDYITREEWFACYDTLLETLGKSDAVTVLELQYLGQVPGEGRIMTDQGNYETSINKNFWNYGTYYQAYCMENKILGVKSELPREEAVADNTFAEKNKSEENSEVTSVLSEKYETVRILLTNDNEQKAFRSSFQIRCDGGCTLSVGDKSWEYRENTVFTESDVSECFSDGNSVVTIMPKTEQTLYIQEADTKEWSAPYRGSISVHRNEYGYWIVNTVSMEEYLYGVVPGEMPMDFQLEALKAQAVCARTFACNMIDAGKYQAYGADVDDSVNSQVYNKNGENEKAVQAVEETKGMILTDGTSSDPADVYYYSSSCGFTTGLEAWGENEVSYLRCVSTLADPEEKYDVQLADGTAEVVSLQLDWDSYLKQTDIQAYDSHSRYFRWTAYLTLPEGYSVKIGKREVSGVVTDICYQKGKTVRHVKTENDIRQDLGKYVTKIVDINGTEDYSVEMLPSAWFTLEKGEKDGSYIVYGGGYGHGIGMSQYGADGMAGEGKSFKEILNWFFPGTTLKTG